MEGVIFYDRKIGGLYVFVDGIFIFIITGVYTCAFILSSVDSLRVFDTLKMRRPKVEPHRSVIIGGLIREL